MTGILSLCIYFSLTLSLSLPLFIYKVFAVMKVIYTSLRSIFTDHCARCGQEWNFIESAVNIISKRVLLSFSVPY